ncbi:MAG: aspartate carbamoyltransferase regulatory subunit [Treponema sp.]|nr:aspartate carbamoyltransferase regulatory subunit [Treponema sp.]
MLNIEKIRNGIVIDHIKSGQGIRIFNWLRLDKAPYMVAFVVNAHSQNMGRKDIIKVDNALSINFDLLGLIDPNITVNVIEDEIITRKIKLKLPDTVENVILCKNPRCITSTEKYVPHIFRLENSEKRSYRCEYCDDIRQAGDFK